MNTNVMHSVLRDSEAGTITFPEVVAALAAANIEGYYKDLLRREVTYYLADGNTHAEPLTLPAHPVPAVFSQDALIAAIRAAQRDNVRYPEFIVRAMEAGTAAYRVFITGRRVIYFGRNGDMHIEHFPAGK
jgi:uncharacterized protein YbcV (DUF1398 family)